MENDYFIYYALPDGSRSFLRMITPNEKGTTDAVFNKNQFVACSFKTLEETQDVLAFLKKNVDDKTVDFRLDKWSRKKSEPEPAQASLQSLVDHCKEASKIVDSWPEWKKRGADVTKFNSGDDREKS